MDFKKNSSKAHSNPKAHEIPCTRSNITGCQATSQRIQSKSWPYKTCGRSHLNKNIVKVTIFKEYFPLAVDIF